MPENQFQMSPQDARRLAQATAPIVIVSMLKAPEDGPGSDVINVAIPASRSEISHVVVEYTVRKEDGRVQERGLAKPSVGAKPTDRFNQELEQRGGDYQQFDLILKWRHGYLREDREWLESITSVSWADPDRGEVECVMEKNGEVVSHSVNGQQVYPTPIQTVDRAAAERGAREPEEPFRLQGPAFQPVKSQQDPRVNVRASSDTSGHTMTGGPGPGPGLGD